MDKRTLIGVGLLVVVIVFSLEWLRSGPSDDIPPEELHRDIFIESAGLGDMETMLAMLELGVDINVHGVFGGPTALIVAATARAHRHCRNVARTRCGDQCGR